MTFEFTSLSSRTNVTNIGLPLMIHNTSGFRIPERITSSVQMDLAGGLQMSSDWKQRIKNNPQVKSQVHTSDDGNSRAILRDQTGSIAACRKHKHSTRILLGSRSNSRDGDGLCRFGRMRLKRLELVIQGGIANSRLRKKTSLGHHENYERNRIKLGAYSPGIGTHQTALDRRP